MKTQCFIASSLDFKVNRCAAACKCYSSVHGRIRTLPPGTASRPGSQRLNLPNRQVCDDSSLRAARDRPRSGVESGHALGQTTRNLRFPFPFPEATMARMALVRILVDGYSLLHNWPELAPGKPRHSAAAREELIHWLTRYHDATGTPITIFFVDGARRPGRACRSRNRWVMSRSCSPARARQQTT